MRRNRLCLATAAVAVVLSAGCGDSNAPNVASPSDVGDSGVNDARSSSSTDAGTDSNVPPTNDAAAPDGLFVQAHGASGLDVIKLTVTLNAPPAKDHALIVTVATVLDHPTKIEGGGASTFSQQASSGQHIQTSVWSAFQIAPGAADTKIVLTWDRLQSFAAVLVSEWAGIGALGNKTTSMGSGKSIQPTALDVLSARVVIATVGTHKTPLMGPTNGFTALDTVATNDLQLLTAYKPVTKETESTPIAPEWTTSNTVSWDAHVVGFRP